MTIATRRMTSIGPSLIASLRIGDAPAGSSRVPGRRRCYTDASMPRPGGPLPRWRRRPGRGIASRLGASPRHHRCNRYRLGGFLVIRVYPGSRPWPILSLDGIGLDSPFGSVEDLATPAEPGQPTGQDLIGHTG